MARARRAALGLHSLGLGRGDRVAILSENCPEWTLTDAGCQLAGVVDVPIYSTQAPPQVCYILNDSGARVLFVQNRAAYDRVAAAIGECASVEHVVFLLETEAQRGRARLAHLRRVRGARLARSNASGPSWWTS